MDLVNIGLAILAGALSLLSPCVLPLVPAVLGVAVSEHRLGPAAVAAGLTLSFAAIGLFFAIVGSGLGLGGDVIRSAGAVLLVLVGVVLMVPPLQTRLEQAAGPISTWSNRRLGGFSTSGVGGQFGVGLLLGAVWTPCVGPTLVAASLLAAQGRNLGQVALTMLAFGLGTGIPLLLLGMVSREALMHWRGRLLSVGKKGKIVLGLVLVATGVIILGGLYGAVERAITPLIPSWLLDLTTRF